jgi:serine/threonine protein phosphatase PrpC
MALSDPQGEPLQLMAVADGHGNRRHWLSQVGSTLACQQAERVVREALASTPLNDHAAWQLLLEEQLPAALVQGWLDATAADWAAQPESQQQAYTPLAYGCTVGLVLMAPQWWGHTGLGDWDLVGVGGGASDGGRGSATAQLFSDEAEQIGGGEATASLCLAEAAALFRPRTGLYRLASSDPPLVLVLSTDGVRKSCASDDDFLRLCSQLGDLADAAALRAGLEQITQLGSGDDVSVALGCWGDVHTSPAIASDTPTVEPQSPTIHRLWAGLRFGLRSQPPWLLPGLLGAALLAGAGWWSWQQRPSPLAQEIARLCAEPWGIQATLNQRRAQFQQLAGPGGAVLAERLRRDATHDPLGALIAASRNRQQPDQACPALQQALAQQWRTDTTAAPAGRMPPGPSRRPAPGALPTSPP